MTMPEKEKEGIDLKSMADATHEVAHGGQKAAKAVVILVSFILSETIGLVYESYRFRRRLTFPMRRIFSRISILSDLGSVISITRRSLKLLSNRSARLIHSLICLLGMF